MLLVITALILLIFTVLLLYSCLKISAPEDREADDIQQAEYLRSLQAKKNSSKERLRI